MSVSESVTLPAQPGSGTLRFVPLGGDGYTAPFAMWQIRDFIATGDSGAGNQVVSIGMDDRYCSLVGYAAMTYTDTAVQDIRWVLAGTQVPLQVRTIKLSPSSASLNTATMSDLWLPPAAVSPGATPVTLSITTLNNDTEVLTLHASIFLFNINARQKMPYQALVAARGGV